MRRARDLVIAVLAVGALAAPAHAGKSSFDYINGIGLIDYASRPKMEVGSWVRYEVKGKSQLGETSDYKVTVLIAGEERLWGDDCFWVETWTDKAEGGEVAVCALISKEIFADSFPNMRSQYFIRKSIEGINPDGSLSENVAKVPASTLKKRQAIDSGTGVHLDTLGYETVTAPTGTYRALHVVWKEHRKTTMDQRDSSQATEFIENRHTHYSPQIPVTGLVKETIENIFLRQSWAIGRSQEAAPANTMDRAFGEAVVVAFGDHEQSRLLPLERQKSLRQLDAAAASAGRTTKAPVRKTR